MTTLIRVENVEKGADKPRIVKVDAVYADSGKTYDTRELKPGESFEVWVHSGIRVTATEGAEIKRVRDGNEAD